MPSEQDNPIPESRKRPSDDINTSTVCDMKNRVGNKFNPHAWAAMKKEKKENKRNLISEVLADYCSHTTLHGIGYLGAKNITVPEKICWIVMFTASLSLCLYLITDTWLKWQQNPVMLSFEKEQTPIWAIPFPSVTVCPINKVRQTVYNYTELFHRRNNLTEDEYKRFWDISLVCNLEQYSANFESTIDITDEDAIQNIFSVAPRENNTIYFAKWQNAIDINLFEEHINKEGLCFSFNSLVKDDMFTNEIEKKGSSKHQNQRNTKWTMEDGYPLNSDLDDYPRRTAQDGYGSGLSFILYSYLTDTDYLCGSPISGYKIILHNPVETAKAAQQYFLIRSDTKATIMVKPELTSTSTSLKSLSAHERKCYFSNEKFLKFFKVYTQNNCRMECEANVTELYCGCVPFYTPRTENMLICGYGKTKCIQEIKQKMLHFHMMEKGINMVEEEMKTTVYKIYDNCDCLPACNHLEFAAEMSHAEIHVMQATQATGLWDNKFSEKQKEELHKGALRVSKIDIFFKESEFLALRRSELYGMTNFVASCGGFLGLFMGFSVLSLVEIIYFLTLRIWCRIRTKT